MTNKTYYTQRDWDRTVGYGQVPYKYSLTAKIMEDKRAQKIMDNETSKLYSEHYGVDEYIDRYANVFKETTIKSPFWPNMTYWRVDMYDKNDMSTYKIKYYEEETNADSAAENWCLGYSE